MTHHKLRPRLATRIATLLGALALAGGAALMIQRRRTLSA